MKERHTFSLNTIYGGATALMSLLNADENFKHCRMTLFKISRNAQKSIKIQIWAENC